MDELITPEQWNDLKYKLQQKYPELTEADLQYHEAREQDLLRMVEYRLHKNKRKMHKVLAWQK